MARSTQNIDKPFSRVKNGLAELQPMWPAYVKGEGGLTVDPQVFRSTFGPNTAADLGGVDDLARTPGIRVEAIMDDGTTPTGTERTITISGSGGFKPICTLNHSASSKTSVFLIAPTAQTADSFSEYSSAYEPAKRSSPLQTEVTDSVRDNGPYPVFMTIQELAEFIDDYRHVGESNADKPAWLPHGVQGREASSSTALPAHTADTRITWMVDTNSESDFGYDALPNDSPYRATVFHPMLLDVNQFHKEITSATTKIAKGYPASAYYANGITRYEPDPEGTDSATIKYKIFGKSGDHLTGLLHANTVDALPMSNFHMSFDSTAVQGPKYRMKMALACFLKDGTYSLNDGAIIPYVYDQTRHIGGTVTSTLYSIWDGLQGYGSEDDSTYVSTNYDETKDCSAQVFPFFDFTQGPLAPSAQSNNWLNEQMTDRHTTDAQSNGGVHKYALAPPPHRGAVLAIEKNSSGGLRIYVDCMTTTEIQELPAGTPIYLEGITGVIGTGKDATFPSNVHRLWPDRWGLRGNTDGTNEEAEDSSVVGRNWNGWWLLSSDSVTTTGDATAWGTALGNASAGTTAYGNSGQSASNRTVCKLTISNGSIFENGLTGDEGFYHYSRGTVYFRIGMIGGSEQGYYHTADASSTAASNSIFSVSKRDANAQGDPSHDQLGTGFQAGVSQMDSNVPARSSEDATYPGRPTIGERSLPSVDGKHRDGKVVLRGISIVSIDGTDNNYISPNIYGEGEGALRIPPPLGYDLCDRYVSTSDGEIVLRADSGFPRMNGEYGHDKWLFRGVSTPFWSFTDTNTGRRAWDYIKPTGVSGTWTYGRNRPWPGHERLGTRLSMSPTLLRSTDHSSTWTSSASGNQVTARESTTKYGLSEMACSPIYLDMEMTAHFPSQANRMVLIEFDGNESHPVFGRHSMVVDTPAQNYGMGIEPMWDGVDIDGVTQYRAPLSVSGTSLGGTSNDLEFFGDSKFGSSTIGTDGEVGVFSLAMSSFQHSGTNLGYRRGGFFGTTPTADNTDITSGTYRQVPGLHNMRRLFWNHTPNAQNTVITTNAYNPLANSKSTVSFPPLSTFNRPAVWMTGGAPHLTTDGTWTGFVDVDGNDKFDIPGTGGFGKLGSGFGTSNYFSFAQGTNTLRTIFNDKGMTFMWNGEVVGTDRSCRIPVWAMSIKMCDIATFPIRTPIAYPSSTDDEWADFWLEGDPAVMNTGLRDYNRDDRLSHGSYEGARYNYYVGPMTYTHTTGPTIINFNSSADSSADWTKITGLDEANNQYFVVATSLANLKTSNVYIGKGTFSVTSNQLIISNFTWIDANFTPSLSSSNNGDTFHVLVAMESEPIYQDAIETSVLGGYDGSDGNRDWFYYPARTLAHVPADPTEHLDSKGEITRLTNPTLQKSNQDLQIDSMTLRQLPTANMLPFTVDTIKQQPATNVGKYTSLNIYAENVDTSRGMDLRVTLLRPPTVATIDQEASTVIPGYEERTITFTGGFGTLDLTDLDTTAITDGFVIRYLFYIPSVSDTLHHPIDWSAIPTITQWDIEYNVKPDADVAVVSNSYDASTATSVGSSDTSFTTKVGHVVTFRVTGSSTDADRKIKEIKVEYGDGTDSGWVEVKTPANSITQDISHVYSTTTGTRNVKAYVKDDNDVESVASDPTITYTITNAAPVAVLRAIPTMVRAGQAIRFDGTSSYSINTSASLSTYAFSFGDGSSDVSGSTAYNDHTYAEAGEYQATLIVTDSNGTASPTVKVVVKVLPATLIVPLTLNTRPSSFNRRRSANFTQTPVLDAVYPEVTDKGQRTDEFEMAGIFLKETENTDIELMEELLQSGALVEFEYEAVNYSGNATNKTFVGRMISFNFQRQGGEVGQTPYTAVFVREAGLGA